MGQQVSALSIVLDAAEKWADELTTYIIPSDESYGPDLEETAQGHRDEADRISAAIKALTSGVEPPTPKISFAPCIQGVIEIGADKSEFLLPLHREDVRYSQWGAYNPVLWPRVDLLEKLAAAAAEWADENLCRTCKENLLDDGEGFDGECGDCADKTEAEDDDDPLCDECTQWREAERSDDEQDD